MFHNAVSLYYHAEKGVFMYLLNSFDPAAPSEYLTGALLSLEKNYGITISIHDHRGLLFDDSGRGFLPKRDFHVGKFCSTGRHTVKGWNGNCLEECAFKAESLALKKLQPFVHKCWKGCSELVVPVERNGELVLVLYAGAFRDRSQPPRFLPTELKRIYKELPMLSRPKMKELSHVLFLFGQGLLYSVDCYRRKDTAKTDRKALIRKFLDDRAHEDVSLKDLARTLCISPSRTSHIVTVLFGMSFQELLLSERMTRARNLLLSTSYPAKEIASAVGFRNVFYFGRVFRNFYGVPPVRFRRKNKSHETL